jgi:transcriptional regulator with XRE-family HTH domain
MHKNLAIEAAFGAALKESRKLNGLSQEQLSFESGLDRSFISQLECGRKQPSLLTLFQLAKALKTTPSLLLSETEKLCI